MAGINVMVADSDAEAERQFTSVGQMFAGMARGQRGKLRPPVDPTTPGLDSPMLSIKAVGSPSTAARQLEEFAERTGADELITVTYAHDPAVRERSLELLADVWF